MKLTIYLDYNSVAVEMCLEALAAGCAPLCGWLRPWTATIWTGTRIAGRALGNTPQEALDEAHKEMEPYEAKASSIPYKNRAEQVRVLPEDLRMGKPMDGDGSGPENRRAKALGVRSSPHPPWTEEQLRREYEVEMKRTDGITLPNFPFINIKLQDGPIGEHGANGCQVDTVLHWVHAVLLKLNEKHPCRQNSLAITKVEEAIHWLLARALDRESRGVEGTDQS